MSPLFDQSYGVTQQEAGESGAGVVAMKGGMTRAALFFLVLTSLAPVGFVYAASLAWLRQWCDAALLGGATAGLVLICVALLGLARSRLSPVPKDVSEIATKESEPLAFLVAYALPLVAAKPVDNNAGGLLAFMIIMGIVLWQGQIFHVNPLLAALGYHFYSGKAHDGAPVLILTKRKTLPSGTLRVIRLSGYLWLYSEISSDAGGHGFPTNDAQGQ